MTTKNRYLFLTLFTVFGIIGGYIYWYYWGCENGCTIKSVWWRMSLWGGLFSFFLGQIILDYYLKFKNKKS